MSAEKMIYLRSRKATDWEEPKLLGKLLSPMTNRLTSIPDYEKVFPQLSEWLIEFGEDEMPGREIGLNSEGTPILAGPNERNYGSWLDTNMKINDFENEIIEKDYFENKWKEFHANETYKVKNLHSLRSFGRAKNAPVLKALCITNI